MSAVTNLFTTVSEFDIYFRATRFSADPGNIIILVWFASENFVSRIMSAMLHGTSEL